MSNENEKNGNENTTANAEKNAKVSLIDQIRKADGTFPVPWMSRDNKGRLTLTSRFMRVAPDKAPPALISYEAKTHGYAVALANGETAKPHDFGVAEIREGSLRKEKVGKETVWVVDLAIDPESARKFEVSFVRVNRESDEPLVNPDGTIMVEKGEKIERFITVPLADCTPAVDPVLGSGTLYRQRPPAKLRKALSREAAEAKSTARESGKSKRVMLTRATVASLFGK